MVNIKCWRCEPLTFRRVTVRSRAVDLVHAHNAHTHTLAAAERAGIDVYFAPDLDSALAQARLFVYISSREGLGSAVLVAMAAGVPVVASRVGGLPEIVVDHETGLLTDNASEPIARAMRRLLEDPELAARLAAQARARVEERFTVNQMVCDTLRVYRRLLEC